MSSQPDPLRLDGNAAAGVLGELFAFEATSAIVTCAGCGAEGALGSLLAWTTPMGTVIRCPGCDTVIIRVVHARDEWLLDLRGAAVVRVGTSPQPPFRWEQG
jgi:Family of unknown function (DUF6510)